ncbi:MAG: twin-arginine translocation signal domain-containing protein, partial [Armatimonadetes bacterium]|nr:twin-arginine translocation signal domain-containing protein [Armatimonadota bacterium]
MDVTRRGFLQAAGGVGLGLGAAPHAAERLIPFLIPPENIVPGIATWYATTCRECPAGCGLILRNREGRVVKAEGNPQHPGNRGALCALGQASLQGLYDPDRVRQPLRLDGEQRTAVPWPEATAAVADLIRRHRGRVSVITDLPGPTMEHVLRQWLAALGVGPERLLIFEPLNYAALRAAHRALYGLDIVPRYSLTGCDVILSLDADFLATWHAPLRLSRELADLREPMGGLMARLIHAGPHLSLTAANADERLVIPPGRESLLALALLH